MSDYTPSSPMTLWRLTFHMIDDDATQEKLDALAGLLQWCAGEAEFETSAYPGLQGYTVAMTMMQQDPARTLDMAITALSIYIAEAGLTPVGALAFEANYLGPAA